MASLNDANKKLDFSCAYEVIPGALPEIDLLYKYGRWLQSNNLLKRDRTVDIQIERLYRIAAEHGHYSANIALQKGAIRGYLALSAADHLRLSQGLIDAKVATGYYFIGIFLQQGSAGLAPDPEMALRYIRKAADEGNPDAQHYVADKLAPIEVARNIAAKMRRCAAEQGHALAAAMYAIGRKHDGEYGEAMKYLQMSVAAGDAAAAGSLEDAFRDPPETDQMEYLGQEEDLGRAERYRSISKILSNYSYASPKVPEINDIIPLPPAPLPEWNGKLQWLEERLANIPPEKPSEALIKRLADEKKLDPATGLPMPGAAGFSMANYPVKVCLSGELCPQTGYWKAMWLPHESRNMRDAEVIRHLKEGEVMPTHGVERNHIRYWPLSDKRTVAEENVRWGLLG